MTRKSEIGVAAILVLAAGVWIAAIKSPKAPAAAPSGQTTYRDSTNNFEVKYDPAFLDFKENFAPTPIEQPWFCKSRAARGFNAEYLTDKAQTGESCRKIDSLMELVNYMAPRGVQTVFETASGTPAILLHSQIMTSGLSGKSGTSDIYRLFVKAPPERAPLWALDFYLVPRKGTLICGDGTCDIGEETESGFSFCRADCPNGKDWRKIIRETFSTLTFFP